MQEHQFSKIRAVSINYPSITKDQVSEEIVLTFFHPMVLIAFSLSMKLTITCHDIVKHNSTFKLVLNGVMKYIQQINCNQAIPSRLLKN